MNISNLTYILLSKLANLKHRLKKWKEVTAQEFPDRPDILDLIPNADKIDINKLTDGCVTTDTCNSAQKTRTMAAMEEAPATRQSNIASIESQRVWKQKKEDLKKQVELNNASDDYIEALIYHSMWDLEVCMKTVNDVTSGLQSLKYKKDKLQALKDNIQIRYRGFSWEEWKTPWSYGGWQFSIPQLTKILKI